MIRALVACGALLCASAAPAPVMPFASTGEGIAPSAHPGVVRVDCDEGSGSAFRIGRNVLASADHVTGLSGCYIHGRPVRVLAHSGDFSLISDGEAARDWLHVDCGGFIAGHRYRAIGFAHGLPTLTEVDITATGEMSGQFAVLSGVFNVIPGQSGGALIDAETGKVVGTVNKFDPVAGLSFSVPLRNTSLCQS